MPSPSTYARTPLTAEYYRLSDTRTGWGGRSSETAVACRGVALCLREGPNLVLLLALGSQTVALLDVASSIDFLAVVLVVVRGWRRGVPWRGVAGHGTLFLRMAERTSSFAG